MEFQVQLEAAGHVAPQSKVISIWDHFRGDFKEGSFSSSIGVVFTSATNILSQSENTFNRLWSWLKTVFRGAQDRLSTLAGQFMKEADRLKIAVSEFSTRMRRRLFIWMLRNSAVEQFDVGNDPNTKIIFRPKVLNTKGTIEIGRLDKDFGVIADIIGFLKILPSVSLEIDVEYDDCSQPQAAGSKTTS
jgi:hypothetical protein